MSSDVPTAEDADANEGALIVIGPQVYFVPRADLRTFKVPANVARTTLATLAERSILRRGHPNDGVILGAVLDPDTTVLQFSSIMEHCLTNSRLH